jgi:tetratricopeptide (TPR) repeat protein
VALRGAEEALKVIGARRSEGLSEAWRLLAEIHLAADRVEAAREAIAKAEAEVVDPGLQGGAVLRIRAALAVRSGATELALTLLDEALALLEAPLAQPERLRVLELRAGLLGRQGREAEAAACVIQAEAMRDAMRLDVGPEAPMVG